MSIDLKQEIVSYETKTLEITKHANGHRAIGSFFAFGALFTHLPLKDPSQARIVESWGISMQMARFYRLISAKLLSSTAIGLK